MGFEQPLAPSLSPHGVLGAPVNPYSLNVWIDPSRRKILESPQDFYKFSPAAPAKGFKNFKNQTVKIPILESILNKPDRQETPLYIEDVSDLYDPSENAPHKVEMPE